MAEETGTVEAVEAVETTDVDTGDTILDTGDSILSESTSTDWREGLPEELANHSALESYKDIERQTRQARCGLPERGVGQVLHRPGPSREVQ